MAEQGEAPAQKPAKTLSSRALYYMGAQVAANFVGLATMMVMTRYFSKQEMGDYQQLMMVYTLLSGIVLLGLPASLTYFYPTSEGGEKPATVYIVMTLLFGLGMVMGAFTFFAAPFLADYFGNEHLVPLIRDFFLFYAFTLGGAYMRRFLVAVNRYRALTIYLQLDRLLMMLSFGVPAAMGLGLDTAVRVAVWVAGLKLVLTTAYTMKLVPPRDMIFNARLIGRILYFSVPLGISAVIAQFSHQIDKLIIGYFVKDAAFFATFTQGAQGIPAVGEVAESVMTVLVPVFAVLYKQGKREQLLATWHESMRKTGIFVLGVFGFVQFFATPLIIGLYSEKYADSVVYFRIYQLALLTRLTMYGHVLQALGSTHQIMAVTAGVLISKGVVNVVMFKTMGPLGPPFGSVAVSTAVGVVYMALISRRLGVGLRRIWPWSYYFRILGSATGAGLVAASVLLLPLGRLSDNLYSSAMWALAPMLTSAEGSFAARLARTALSAAGSPSLISFGYLALGLAIFLPLYLAALQASGILRDKDWALVRDATYGRILGKSGMERIRRMGKAVGKRLPRLRCYVICEAAPAADKAGALARAGFGIDEMTVGTLARAAEFRKPEIVATLRKYLEKGCRGVYATDGDTIAGYALLATTGREPAELRRVRLCAGEAAVILVYTRPEYRGRGVATALLDELNSAAARSGASKIVTWTVLSNKASQKVQRKGGGAYAGKVFILELLGRPVWRHTFGSAVAR